jgi:hypothetical protein
VELVDLEALELIIKEFTVSWLFLLMEQITVSELIVQLTNILAKHGDVKVYRSSGGDYEKVEKATFDVFHLKADRTTINAVFID